MFRFTRRKSKVKTIVAMFQFPPSYPSSSVLIELRSKTIDTNLLSRLTVACEQESKTLQGIFMYTRKGFSGQKLSSLASFTKANHDTVVFHLFVFLY